MAEASIVVKLFRPGVHLFTWEGPEDGCVRISDEISKDQRLMGLIPWPLERVGHNPYYGYGLYRRVQCMS